ncbi:helix-turn-helix transcriptional regulator [Aureibacter tunicatorum]|uniref:DNA-binding transcriptional regulator YafY n=1 Tax=Aureibacter tunicatorum TaxID=866807 RepID=A0AAE3XS23_9BACT|nr:YafY family protein [Aureibacter tunicatorum]MDR6240930.1 putative DNA-binding transcriptional regulator YafY [Aureibacter tunicatorum]BDD03710.1 hypothetical protein AUTU_11930 [Aureibacter tunicatorum]
MNRIDRLSAIMTMLQSKKVVKAKEIAERFEISLRTVYRDIRALEEGGVPIGAEAGLGYYISDGYHLAPVTFTGEEARALLLSQKVASHFTDESSVKHQTTAFEKIRSVMKTADKEKVETLESSIDIHFGFKRVAKPSAFLDQIQEAMSMRNKMQLKYQAASESSPSLREIVPLSLCYYSNYWHLIAFCELRNDYRDFRTDRIVGIQSLSKLFNKEAYKSMDEYWKEIRQRYSLYEVEVVLDNKGAPFLNLTKHYWGFKEESIGEDDVRMKFVIADYRVFSKWLISFGEYVHKLYPDELENAMNEEIQALQSKFLQNN